MAQSRGRAVVWIAVLGMVGSTIALLVILSRSRHPDSGSRKTTTTHAEVQRDAARPTGAAPPACKTHADCADGALCPRGTCEPITPMTTECRTVLIRFARGARELSSSAEVEVERVARCASADEPPTLEIEPSRDRNRSAEANDELTSARVTVVRRALEQRGVAPEQVPTVRFSDPIR